MAEINLLKQNSPSGSFVAGLPKILVWLFLAVLILLVGYYGWLFFDSKNIDNQAREMKNKIFTEEQSIAGEKDRQELLARQTQLKSLQGIISVHPYWSQLFSSLAKVTLKNANYSVLEVNSTSPTLTLNVTVPTIEDFDKYIQVFDIPDFNKNFSNVRIGGYTKIPATETESAKIQFQVLMDFDPSLIQYNAKSAN